MIARGGGPVPVPCCLDGLLCGHSDEHDGSRDECGESDGFSVIAMLNSPTKPAQEPITRPLF